MTESFDSRFQLLTGNLPFPWQRALYDAMLAGEIPSSCKIPTGLGKTSVIAAWLLALAERPQQLPRRLVYVVNRRTVVDQTTDEVLAYRDRLSGTPLEEILLERCGGASMTGQPVLGISTLRGQFADNREWQQNPARPAVICGTVDMIGSRLLFQGYSVGWKSRPLHAGFLGQDALIVHDEAHLEHAFQELLEAIVVEQRREGVNPRPLRVMALTATSRQTENTSGLRPSFELQASDFEHPTIQQRLRAEKRLQLHPIVDEKRLADAVADRVLKYSDSGAAILVFLRTVEDVLKVQERLQKKMSVATLTGTMRGLERDRLTTPGPKSIFARFLPRPLGDTEGGTVCLACTAAGEVGVNLSADHLACDLSTYESMAQRFGRVNRFGIQNPASVDVFHSTKFDTDSPYERARQRTLELLQRLDGNACPEGLSQLDPIECAAAFAPPPDRLPVTDILFDAWALTTIRERLPGRQPVEPFLHGLPTEWQPPETRIAWRLEVELITEPLQQIHPPRDLLDDYPLRPHELLKDTSRRVFDCLKKLASRGENAVAPVWIIDAQGDIKAVALADVISRDADSIADATVILPPSVGGLSEQGLMNPTAPGSESLDIADVTDETPDRGGAKRVRVRDGGPDISGTMKGMRLIRRIKLTIDGEDADDDTGPRDWLWYEQPSEGSLQSLSPVLLETHVADVVREVERFITTLPLPDDVRHCLRLAARYHDLGKERTSFQRLLQNDGYPARPPLAKSGQRSGRLPEAYRHEFGSLIDLHSLNDDAEWNRLGEEERELVLHLIAAHHGRARPHFPINESFDVERSQEIADQITHETPRRFARLQRRYGRWGLAYLESLLRAADWSASAHPSQSLPEAAP